MEELQDAIEDAQYMNAVHDDSPKPSKPWKFMEPRPLRAYIENIRATKPELMTLKSLCASPTGFFLFTKHARVRDYGALGDFLMDCAKYRTCAAPKRLKVALKIKNNFLIDESSGRTNPVSSLTLCRVMAPAVMNSPGSRETVPEWSTYMKKLALAANVGVTAMEMESPYHKVNNPAVSVCANMNENSGDDNSSKSMRSPVVLRTEAGIYMVDSGSENGKVGSIADDSINGEENAIGVYGYPLAEVLHYITEALISDQVCTASYVSSSHSTTRLNDGNSGANFNPCKPKAGGGGVPQFNISAGQGRPDSDDESSVAPPVRRKAKPPAAPVPAETVVAVDAAAKTVAAAKEKSAEDARAVAVAAAAKSTELKETADCKEVISQNGGNGSAALSVVTSPLGRPQHRSIRSNNSGGSSSGAGATAGGTAGASPLRDGAETDPISQVTSGSAVFEQQNATMDGSLPPPLLEAKLLPKTLFDTLDIIVYNFLEEALWPSFQKSAEWDKFWQFHAIAAEPVGEEDFSLFRVLGRGGFGMVNMCKRAQSGKLFAIKMMNKKRVKLKRSESLCLKERSILAAIDSPYVVCLKFSFVTATDLYLVVDLMMGGDMSFHLHRKGHFALGETKYFAARILMGLMALHEKDIVYRDLKPENILMDNDGYTRISDLGLATNITRSGLSGSCGTRGYWAPEMLRKDSNGKREKYFKQVDWFSFGCVIYEFLVGCSPFRTPKARQYKLNIVPGGPRPTKEERDMAIDNAIKEMEPEFDPGLFRDPVTITFLQQLLHKNAALRLGANGGSEIYSHPWFKDMDWEQLAVMKPPWKPARNINMAPQQEIGVFNDEKESMRVVLLNEDHRRYDDWGFVNKEAFEEEVVMYLRYEEMGKLDEDEMPGHSAHDDGNISTCCSVS